MTPPIDTGDLLFYISSGQFIDKVIATVTKSRFVHVAIAISSTEKIEMLGQGCVKSPIYPNVPGVYHFPYIFKDSELRVKALEWLMQQVGTAYGYQDWPESLDTSHKFAWVQTEHRDCSDLAVAFYKRCGVVEVINLDDHRTVPGGLANALGVK